MTQAANALLETLLQLSEIDRGEVVARLLESLDSKPDDGTEADWQQEIAIQVEQIRTGQIKPIPWATAREQIMDDSDGGS